jgi:hypothetical protein
MLFGNSPRTASEQWQSGKDEPANEECAYAADETIHSARVGRSIAPAIENEQLLPDHHGFGNHATDPTRPRQPNQNDN